jgi:hypothetical protein
VSFGPQEGNEGEMCDCEGERKINNERNVIIIIRKKCKDQNEN